MEQQIPAEEPLRVGLIGAGRGGTALLQLFATAPTVRVVAVADPDPQAPGRSLARARGIPVMDSHLRIFEYDPEIVIEVTGRAEVLEELTRAKPAGVELVGAQSARLFWEFIVLRAREAQQVERAETVRRMTGGIFHSLNNVFATLLGRASLLVRSLEGKRWTPAQLAEGLRIIAQTVAQGSDILKRLRQLTRDRAEPAVTRMDVNEVIREVVALADPLVRGALTRSATIEVRLELGEVSPVLGRPAELIDVLLNLVVNAIDAMPTGGILTLESGRDGANVLVRVKDTGAGVPDAVRAQLFTPFFTTKPQGTGLGLSVSREIVRQHGGDIALESVEGKGTCVTVTLPVAAAGPSGRGMLPSLAGWRALIADDDPFVRELLVDLLATSGCHVRAAGAGGEALACVEREPFDLVLADIVMPEVTGWQVARAARAQNPAAVVILFSGWELRPEDPSLAEIGADAFLPKPIHLPAVMEAVQRALAARLGPQANQGEAP